jgi:hypothetical protein
MSEILQKTHFDIIIAPLDKLPGVVNEGLRPGDEVIYIGPHKINPLSGVVELNAIVIRRASNLVAGGLQ